MKKNTQQLLNYYFSLLSEQQPGQVQPSIDQGTQPVSAPVNPASQESPGMESPSSDDLDTEGSKPIDKRKQSLVIALALAFIFDPKEYEHDEASKNRINKKIKVIKGNTNLSIPEVIDNIGDVICLNRNLCVRFREFFPDLPTIKFESKTVKTVNKMLVLLEQGDKLDATEKQDRDQQTDGSDMTLQLDAIFPLYRELLLNALLHSPEPNEIFMVSQAIDNLIDVDVEKSLEIIMKILDVATDEEDKELKTALSIS